METQIAENLKKQRVEEQARKENEDLDKLSQTSHAYKGLKFGSMKRNGSVPSSI